MSLALPAPSAGTIDVRATAGYATGNLHADAFETSIRRAEASICGALLGGFAHLYGFCISSEGRGAAAVSGSPRLGSIVDAVRVY